MSTLKSSGKLPLHDVTLVAYLHLNNIPYETMPDTRKKNRIIFYVTADKITMDLILKFSQGPQVNLQNFLTALEEVRDSFLPDVLRARREQSLVPKEQSVIGTRDKINIQGYNNQGKIGGYNK